MYVSPISTRFSLGKSTPAIRAICISSIYYKIVTKLIEALSRPTGKINPTFPKHILLFWYQQVISTGSYVQLKYIYTEPVPFVRLPFFSNLIYHNQTRTHCLRQFFWNHLFQGLTLSLFMLRVFTDYSDSSFSFDDFAFFANRFYWWSYFHVNTHALSVCRRA